MNLFGYRSRISGLGREKRQNYIFIVLLSCAHTDVDDVRWTHSPSEEVESMDTDQDVTVGVNLQQVSIHGIKHEAPESQRR